MNLLDVLYPKKCVRCGKTGGYVCEKCEVGLWEEEQICPQCRRESRYGMRHKFCRNPYGIDGLTCFWAYEGIARKLIRQAKHRFYYDYLGELLRDVNVRVNEMPEYAGLKDFMEKKPVIVPVPLYPRREKERGFNQAEVISRMVASRWSLEMKNLLSRIRDTGRQAGRDRVQRQDAIKDAFKLKTENQLPKTVLLVDDVWITGATMNECTGLLKKGGVKSVWGLVLAR